MKKSEIKKLQKEIQAVISSQFITDKVYMTVNLQYSNYAELEEKTEIILNSLVIEDAKRYDNEFSGNGKTIYLHFK